MRNDMVLNVEYAVFVQRHLVQGAGVVNDLEFAAECTVVDGGAVQLEFSVCAV